MGIQACNLLDPVWHEQALKNNPDHAPRNLKFAQNQITNFARVALTEALDMVYEIGGREIVITM